MSKLDYDSVPATGEYDATKAIAEQVEEVTDVAHLGPFVLDRETANRKQFVFNNTDEDGRPPLIVKISDDAEVKLLTTAYGEATVTAGQHKLARKATPRDESAEDWFRNNFEVEN